MYDGMPNALTVNGTAARFERAWTQVSPLVRISTAAAVVLSAAVAATPFASGVDGWWSLCGVVLALAAVIDVHERRLPNGLLTVALLASLVPTCLRADDAMALRAVCGGLLAGCLLMVARTGHGVGMGDVKMAAVIGVSLGCFGMAAPLLAIAVAATVGALYGFVRGRAQVAFGPALWFGWMSVLIGLSTGWWS